MLPNEDRPLLLPSTYLIEDVFAAGRVFLKLLGLEDLPLSGTFPQQIHHLVKVSQLAVGFTFVFCDPLFLFLSL